MGGLTEKVALMTDEQKRRVVLKALTAAGNPPMYRHRYAGETQKRAKELMRQYDESLNVTKVVQA